MRPLAGVAGGMNFLEIDLFMLSGILAGVTLVCLGLAALWIRAARALAAAKEAERNFNVLQETISEGVYRCTPDGLISKANPAICRLHGYESELELLDHAAEMAQSWYVDPERAKQIGHMLLTAGRVDGSISEVRRHRTGERIWVEENIRLVRDPRTKQPRWIEGTVRDVTDSVRRIELQQRTEKIASLVSGCLYQQRTWPDGRLELPYASVGIATLLGVTPEQVQADPTILFDLVDPEDEAALLDSFRVSASNMTARHFEYRVILKDGTKKWVRGQSVPEPQADGSILWHGFVADITDSKQVTARVYDLAYVDTLTRLPNRAALVEGLQATLEQSGKGGHWNALLFIDLDQFKVLNDTKGHHFGDRLLREVAGRLKPAVGEDSLVARFGGDEFVVLLRKLAVGSEVAEQQVSRIVERVHTAIAEPFLLDGFPFHTNASIGAALFRGNETSVDELLKRADMAMYEAKASGPGSASFFAPEMQAILEERMALTAELRDALEAGKLMLHYQPQVDQSGTPFGVEALLRWEHPQRGLVPPAIFVPLAERAGFSERLDAFVLMTACETLTRWQRMPAMSHLQMSVNIGCRRISSDLVSLVTSALNATGADAKRLTLEITERVMLDHGNEVDTALAELKRLGVKIFLDDFGTGYSSLAHLKRLPIDALKVDYSFVRDIETDQNDRVIVQTILNIARNLGMAVVAEGVESEIQALLLQRFGCHAFQGFLYGRPMPLEEIERRSMVAQSPRMAVMQPTRLVV